MEWRVNIRHDIPSYFDYHHDKAHWELQSRVSLTPMIGKLGSITLVYGVSYDQWLKLAML